jgi:phage FluMu protein Com
MIEFRCKSCQKLLHVKEERAFVKYTCPACGAPVEVPLPVKTEQEPVPMAAPAESTLQPAGPKKRSLAGLVGMALAVVSLAFCWFAPVGIPAAVIGLVLVAIGLVKAFQHKTGLVLPIIGAYISLGALVSAVMIPGASLGPTTSGGHSEEQVPAPQHNDYVSALPSPAADPYKPSAHESGDTADKFPFTSQDLDSVLGQPLDVLGGWRRYGSEQFVCLAAQFQGDSLVIQASIGGAGTLFFSGFVSSSLFTRAESDGLTGAAGSVGRVHVGRFWVTTKTITGGWANLEMRLDIHH